MCTGNFYGPFVIYRIFFTYSAAVFSFVQSTKVTIDVSESYKSFMLSLVSIYVRVGQSGQQIVSQSIVNYRIIFTHLVAEWPAESADGDKE